MSEWRTIESAPPYEQVLLWCASHDITGKPKGVVMGQVIQFSDGTKEARGDHMTGDWEFTGWKPLPSPPETST